MSTVSTYIYCITQVLCKWIHVYVYKSSKARLEGASGIIWSKLSWEKHGLDKTVQHPGPFHLDHVYIRIYSEHAAYGGVY